MYYEGMSEALLLTISNSPVIFSHLTLLITEDIVTSTLQSIFKKENSR